MFLRPIGPKRMSEAGGPALRPRASMRSLGRGPATPLADGEPGNSHRPPHYGARHWNGLEPASPARAGSARRGPPDNLRRTYDAHPLQRCRPILGHPLPRDHTPAVGYQPLAVARRAERLVNTHRLRASRPPAQNPLKNDPWTRLRRTAGRGRPGLTARSRETHPASPEMPPSGAAELFHGPSGE